MVYWNSKPYTKDEFVKAWNTSISIAEVIRKLGYKNPGGGTYGTIKDAAIDLNLSSNHMLGQSHSKGKPNNAKRMPIEEILVKGKHSSKIKKRLLDEGILKAKCSNCGITKWNGKDAPLELDHRDGDNTNNLLENLRLLCCNCHAQTDNYKGKNIKNRKVVGPKYFCQDCNDPIKTRGAKRCVNCYHKFLKQSKSS